MHQELHTIIIGAGFGGLAAARALAKKGIRVTLIDRRNYHLFTPLLYQVATGSLAPGEIAVPIRVLFRNDDNVRCLMATVQDVDVDASTVTLDDGQQLSYHYLVIASGAESHYFGNAEWGEYVYTLDDLDSAVELRDRWISLFEKAELEPDQEKRRELLTVSIIGAGPSGVELAGALADASRKTLFPDYRNISWEDMRIYLFEAMDRVLPGFDEESSESAREQLEELGVIVRTGSPVDEVREGAVVVGGVTFPSGLICWGAGVSPARLEERVAAESESDGIVVDENCSLRNHPRVFVVGDTSHFRAEDGPLPGLAPVALQQGEHVARTILRDIRGQERRPFVYRNKGLMATIGPGRAVVQTGPLRLSGRLAWLSWVVLHIWYLVGFRTRLFVLLEWAWAFVGQRRGNRLIRSEGHA